MSTQPAATHADFAILGASWELSLSADGYAANTLASYRRALANFATWLATTAPGIGPAEATREHVRGWIVHVRETASSGTARSWFAGLRHFCRWAVSENELDSDPTEGIKTPRPNDKRTPVLSSGNLRTFSIPARAGISCLDGMPRSSICSSTAASGWRSSPA